MQPGGASANWVVRSAVPSVAGHGVGPVISAPTASPCTQGIETGTLDVGGMVDGTREVSLLFPIKPAVSGAIKATAMNATTPPVINCLRRSALACVAF